MFNYCLLPACVPVRRAAAARWAAPRRAAVVHAARRHTPPADRRYIHNIIIYYKHTLNSSTTTHLKLYTLYTLYNDELNANLVFYNSQPLGDTGIQQ